MSTLVASRPWCRCPALVLALAFAVACGTAVAAPNVLHVSPNAADAPDEGSEKGSFASLQEAVSRARAMQAGGAGEVEIWIEPARYVAQRVKFEALPSGKSLVIRGRPNAAARPVFDGDGQGGAWLVMLAKKGQAGNVQISGLEVINYATAISMSGSRDDSTQQVVNVVIRDNSFKRIGQIASPDGPPSAAAVRLVNAHNVSIVGNRFSEIKNLKRCSSLHAIYVAHGSTNNLIENNVFEDSCGDPIRFRDGSDNNRVIRNTFVNAWAKAPVTDWYCDSDAREDCTKATAECPSYGNVVEGNTVRGKGKNAPPMILTYGADQNSACRAKGARSVGSEQRFLVR